MLFWISVADQHSKRFIGAYVEDLPSEQEAVELTRTRHPTTDIMIWELEEEKRPLLQPHFGKLLKQEDVHRLFGPAPVIFDDGSEAILDGIPPAKN